MENIAKLTSYGCYLDCDFETAKYPDDKIHIVGLLAEYVYDLEQRILHYDKRYAKLWNEIETLRECVSKEFDQDQKISDLETKLAESEIRSKESEIFYKREINRRDTKLRNIKQSLKETIDHYEKYCAELNSQNVMLYASAFNLSQDKISFAVAQLEKVKVLCKEKFNWWENSEWEGNIYDKSDVSNAYFDIDANIDEQIEQLTHQHEDKGE